KKRISRLFKPAATGDNKTRRVRLLNGDPHLPQGRGHQGCVLALERSGEMACASGQGGEQQGPIGDRLAAGWRYATDQRTVRRRDGVSGGKRVRHDAGSMPYVEPTCNRRDSNT